MLDFVILTKRCNSKGLDQL